MDTDFREKPRESAHGLILTIEKSGTFSQAIHHWIDLGSGASSFYPGNRIQRFVSCSGNQRVT
jgi:hypothetical protein